MSGVDLKYARALLEAAREKGKIEILQSQSGELLKLLEETEDLEVLLNSPQISTSRKKEFIQNLIGGELEGELLNFILLLIDRERQGRLQDILRLFIRLGDRERNIVKARVYTVELLEEKEKDMLRENLSRALNKTVIIENRIDRGILGGIKVKAGNVLLDGSLQGRLDELKQHMKKAKLQEAEVVPSYDAQA